MKEKETIHTLTTQKLNHFICPFCKKNLKVEKRSLICQNNHCFDIAKEGYVNLLPVNSKNKKNPGDNLKMMEARRAFLESGHYQPLAEKLVEIIDKIATNETKTILDLGCGEGYYPGYIQKELQSLNLLGLDISKIAVRNASKKYKDISFCVASAFEIPVEDNFLDIILRIYAPSLESELYRTIKSGGFLITVTPGERHLHQMREIIYTEVNVHKEDHAEVKGFTLVDHIKLKYTLKIRELETVKNLLDMTPFGWKISDQDKARLFMMKNWEIDCDFNIEIHEKIN